MYTYIILIVIRLNKATAIKLMKWLRTALEKLINKYLNN